MIQYLGKKTVLSAFIKIPPPDYSGEGTSQVWQCKLKSKKSEMAHLLFNIKVLNNDPFTLTGQPCLHSYILHDCSQSHFRPSYNCLPFVHFLIIRSYFFSPWRSSDFFRPASETSNAKSNSFLLLLIIILSINPGNQ